MAKVDLQDLYERFSDAEVVFITQNGYELAPARVRAYNFARACRARGMRAEVLSFRDHLCNEDDTDSVWLLPESRKYRMIADAIELLSGNQNTILYCQKIDYHNLSACAVATRLGNPLIIDYDDYDLGNPIFTYSQNLIVGLQSQPFTMSVMKGAKRCIAASRSLLELVQQMNPNSHWLPTGPDLNRFDVALRDDGRTGPVEILWLGDFWGTEVLTDVLFAVSAFAALPPDIRGQARFTIIGFGVLWDQFKAIIAENMPGLDNLVYRERIAADEAPMVLAGFDIGVVPLKDSPFNHCKSPTKMFEFMAMKVAICGTPVGEAGRILTDGVSAMLAGDLAGYMQRLGMLIIDADLRRRLAENAFRIVREDLNLDSIGDRLVAILRQVQQEHAVEMVELHRKAEERRAAAAAAIDDSYASA